MGTTNHGADSDRASQFLIDWLAARQEAMINLLRDLVDADSGTYDKAGVDAAGEILVAFWRQHGFQVERFAHDRFGDGLSARLAAAGDREARPILLLGHRDTVFPRGEPERRPFQIVDGRGYGPGVADMKSGLVIEAFVMAGLAAFGGTDRPLVMLTTSDEEIASPSSRPLIESHAREAFAVFNAEPSRKGESEDATSNRHVQIITRQRKGGVFLRATFTGKAAHSGAHYARGRSAILDLSQKVAPLHALTDLARGISVNVGLIGGGQTVNTISPSAWCEIDLRYIEPNQRDAAVAAIRSIVETPAVEGVTAALDVLGEFLPLIESAGSVALLDIYRRAAARFGIDVTAELTGGCADSGYTAAAGCPTLCSIGPSGGGGHTPDEYIEMDSLLTSAQTLGLAVLETAKRPDVG